jgi:hypothetical protein
MHKNTAKNEGRCQILAKMTAKVQENEGRRKKFFKFQKNIQKRG